MRAVNHSNDVLQGASPVDKAGFSSIVDHPHAAMEPASIRFRLDQRLGASSTFPARWHGAANDVSDTPTRDGTP